MADKKKKPIALRIDPELLARLEAVASRQKYPPTFTSLIEAAIRQFVEGDERDAKRHSAPPSAPDAAKRKAKG